MAGEASRSVTAVAPQRVIDEGKIIAAPLSFTLPSSTLCQTAEVVAQLGLPRSQSQFLNRMRILLKPSNRPSLRATGMTVNTYTMPRKMQQKWGFEHSPEEVQSTRPLVQIGAADKEVLQWPLKLEGNLDSGAADAIEAPKLRDFSSTDGIIWQEY
ncbi:MAG: hypothetical protein MMC33_004434 [Icmadophila ericetorum]|nr:hypothetical protein [Icmadophila ericetorum]